jgi:hypothetical protein
VQDGNWTLVRTIQEFSGSSAQAFLAQLGSVGKPC